jgi:hypothetical protein
MWKPTIEDLRFARDTSLSNRMHEMDIKEREILMRQRGVYDTKMPLIEKLNQARLRILAPLNEFSSFDEIRSEYEKQIQDVHLHRELTFLYQAYMRWHLEAPMWNYGKKQKAKTHSKRKGKTHSKRK